MLVLRRGSINHSKWNAALARTGAAEAQGSIERETNLEY
jgi:hypothetical protein